MFMVFGVEACGFAGVWVYEFKAWRFASSDTTSAVGSLAIDVKVILQEDLIL